VPEQDVALRRGGYDGLLGGVRIETLGMAEEPCLKVILPRSKRRNIVLLYDAKNENRKHWAEDGCRTEATRPTTI
jgi:hypothetical protein